MTEQADVSFFRTLTGLASQQIAYEGIWSSWSKGSKEKFEST